MIQGAAMDRYQAQETLYDWRAQRRAHSFVVQDLEFLFSSLVYFPTGLGKTSLFKIAELVTSNDF